MLIEVDQKEFKNRFILQPHPFLALPFLELNRYKVDRLVYLIENKKRKVDIGLVVGIIDNVLLSPFSAPFGGFHFRHNNIRIKEIDLFLEDLKTFMTKNSLIKIKLTLPPDLYHASLNAKTINVLLRNGFEMQIPEITNWVDLIKFSGSFSDGNTRTNYNKAVKAKLVFKAISNVNEKKSAFDLICKNRQKFSRPIYMTFTDLLKTSNLWPIDFFKVVDEKEELLAAAIFYRAHPEIIYGAFWGDTALGRTLKAMDFLAFNLWNHYKELDFNAIDFGISTESGVPNEGLLRFKEAHDSVSSLRYSFQWQP